MVKEITAGNIGVQLGLDKVAEGDARADGWANFNPFFPGHAADADHCVPVVLSMFDNSTKFTPGQNVMVDHDVTASTQGSYRIIEGDEATWGVDLSELCDPLGNPSPHTPEMIASKLVKWKSRVSSDARGDH